MMRKVTFLMLAIGLFGSTYAQISFDADTIENPRVYFQSFDYKAKSYLTNNSIFPSDTILTWRLISNEKPEEWTASVCISDELCINEPEGDRDYNLGIGEKIDFILGFTFQGIVDTGWASLEVRSKSNPAMRDTFTLKVITTLSSITKMNDKQFTVYPNPSTDFINIKLVADNFQTIKVYDALGNIKLSKTVKKRDQIDIRSLAKGIYVIRLEGDHSFSKVIQKQ